MSDRTDRERALQAEVYRLRQKIRQQRLALCGLNDAYRKQRFERAAKAIEKNVHELRFAAAEFRSWAGGSKTWNAGMHFGMKLARDIVQHHVSTLVVEYLTQEIGWRFEGLPNPGWPSPLYRQLTAKGEG